MLLAKPTGIEKGEVNFKYIEHEVRDECAHK